MNARGYLLSVMFLLLMTGAVSRTERCFELALQCEGCATDQECWDCLMRKAKKHKIDCSDIEEMINELPEETNKPKVQL